MPQAFLKNEVGKHSRQYLCVLIGEVCQLTKNIDSRYFRDTILLRDNPLPDNFSPDNFFARYRLHFFPMLFALKNIYHTWVIVMARLMNIQPLGKMANRTKD